MSATPETTETKLLPLKLVRLTYPLVGKSIPPELFGPSSAKHLASRSYFKISPAENGFIHRGEPQAILDKIHAARATMAVDNASLQFAFTHAVTDTTEITLSRTDKFWLLGSADLLPAFKKAVENIPALYAQEDSLIIHSGMRDVELEDSADQMAANANGGIAQKLRQNTTPNLSRETLGWLDLNHGAFILRTPKAVPHLQRLFGFQDVRYPQSDLKVV